MARLELPKVTGFIFVEVVDVAAADHHHGNESHQAEPAGFDIGEYPMHGGGPLADLVPPDDPKLDCGVQKAKFSVAAAPRSECLPPATIEELPGLPPFLERGEGHSRPQKGPSRRGYSIGLIDSGLTWLQALVICAI
jgi:hypothetical protein